MSAAAISFIAFACVFGGSLLGMFLRVRLPEHHLSTDSKDFVKLGMGLIATMAALVLGLLIASAKSSYDIQRNELTQSSANIILLDRLLANFGPDTKEARDLLRRSVVRALDQAWPENRSRAAQLEPGAPSEALYDQIYRLAPRNEDQRLLKSQALTISVNLRQTRWLEVEQRRGSSIPMAVLAVLIFWLAIYLRQLRALCAPQRNRRRHHVRLCAFGFRCGLPDPGAGSAIRGVHCHPQRSTARRSCAPRPVNMNIERQRTQRGVRVALPFQAIYQRWRILVVSGILLALSGCLGPVSLHRAVLEYDRTVTRIEWEMLLLNIARLGDGLPVHFTVTSSIAATFNYQISAAVAGSYNTGGGSPGFFIPSVSVGAVAAENPTLSIVPIQGRDFTERVLTPMADAKFEFLVFQGWPLDMVMRLMADGIEVQTPEGRFERFILNWPTHPKEYEEFRRMALHLVWLNNSRNLFVSRLAFVEATPAVLSAAPPADEVRNAAEKNYRWRQVQGVGLYELERRVTGRVVITNYDPRALSDAERATLNTRAANNPGNFVLIDVRPGHPGGDWPLFGALKLRSLNRLLDFVAENDVEVREYDVTKDPRSGDSAPNPARTLAIEVSESAPAGDAPFALYRGHYYTVADTHWDRRAFTVLYELFQMTVTDVSQVGLPITISK